MADSATLKSTALDTVVALKPERADWLHCSRQRHRSDSTAAVPLRVLFVSTSWGEGGIERHSVSIAEQMAKRGMSVTFACCPGGTLEWICGQKKIETQPLATCNSGDLISAFDLARLILRQDMHIVHIHSRRDFVIAVLAVACARLIKSASRGIQRQRHIRLPVLVLHSHLLKPMGMPARLSGRFFEEGAHGVIAVSEATRAHLIAAHNFQPNFVSVIHNGIDLRQYAMPPQMHCKQRKQKRRQWSVPDESLVVGMVGRLGAKGQSLLLKAAPRLLSRFPTVRFVLVGPEGEAGVRDSLEQAAEKAGIASQVVFTGPSEVIPAMLAGMDIFVHLPEEEAFGLVLAEAMASGLPVVATDVGGCREVVESGVTGLLIEVNNEQGLIQALSSLLAPHAELLRQRMGEAGQERARQMFSIEQQIESLEAYYLDMLETHQ